MTERPEPRPEGRRRFGHDVAGEAYPTGDLPRPGDSVSSEPVTSRSTEAAARDIVAIRRAKRGDTGAFAKLLQANDRAVRALLWALAGPERLDPLCTRVYLRAYRGLPLAPTGAPQLWLLGIADGAARDEIRRWQRHAPPGEPPAVPLDAPADQRLVLAAVEAVGLTTREAARLADRSVEHTRELLETARAGLDVPLPGPPDHRPGFWDDLGRRLLIEQSQPAATGPRDIGDVPDTPSFPVPTGSDVARGMAVRVAQQNPRSFPWRRIGLGLAILVSVVAVVGVAVSIAHRATTRDAGLGDTAAKVLDQLDQALAGDTVIRGVATIEAPGTDLTTDRTVAFSRTNAGSWRNVSTDGSLDEGYDVPGARFATVHRGSDGGGTAEVHAGIAPGPPLATATSDDTLGDLLADSIRVVRAGSNGSVTTRAVSEGDGEDTDDQRMVWEVTSDREVDRRPTPLAGTGLLERIPADNVELVADRSLALPTRLTLRRDDRVLLRIDFSDLAISQQRTRSSYAPEPPETVGVTRTDGGFASTTLGELASRDDVMPSYLPPGYVLTTTAVDIDDDTVVVCYRNGSRQLVLTRRPAQQPADVTGGERTVTIASGSFSGRDARVWTEPLAQVRVADADTEVTVVGDPPLDELEKVVASLR